MANTPSLRRELIPFILNVSMPFLFKRQIETSLLRLFVCLSLFAPFYHLHAQTPWQKQLRTKEEKLYPLEYIYAQTDRTIYSPGETIWFTAYLLGAQKGLAPPSQYIYAQLIGPDGAVKEEFRLEVVDRMARGYFQLAKTATIGGYQLQLYSQWQKNFGTALFFKKELKIESLGPSSEQAIGNQREKLKKLQLQFQPEGGYLLANCANRLAIKTADEKGRSIAIKAVLLNQKKEVLAQYETYHAGIGSLVFSPQQNETYTLKVLSPIEEEYPLPKIRNKGLHLSCLKQENQVLSLNIFSTKERAVELLIEQAEGLLIKKKLELKKGNQQYHIPLKDGQKGLAQLSLRKVKGPKLLQRIFFLQQEEVQYLVHKKLDYKKDSSLLRLQLKDADNRPLKAQLSFALTIEEEKRPRDEEHLLSYSLLSIPLSIPIEQAGFYLNKANPKADSALDNLLLSQSWAALHPLQPAQAKIKLSYPAEVGGQLRALLFWRKLPLAHKKVAIYDSSGTKLLQKIKTNAQGEIYWEENEFQEDLIVKINHYGYQLSKKIYYRPPCPPYSKTITKNAGLSNQLSAKVLDYKGEPMYYLFIDLCRENECRTVQTSWDGTFKLDSLVPGRYDLHIRGREHEDLFFNNICLAADDSLQLTVSYEGLGLASKLEVNSEPRIRYLYAAYTKAAIESFPPNLNDPISYNGLIRVEEGIERRPAFLGEVGEASNYAAFYRAEGKAYYSEADIPYLQPHLHFHIPSSGLKWLNAQHGSPNVFPSRPFYPENNKTILWQAKIETNELGQLDIPYPKSPEKYRLIIEGIGKNGELIYWEQQL